MQKRRLVEPKLQFRCESNPDVTVCTLLTVWRYSLLKPSARFLATLLSGSGSSCMKHHTTNSQNYTDFIQTLNQLFKILFSKLISSSKMGYSDLNYIWKHVEHPWSVPVINSFLIEVNQKIPHRLCNSSTQNRLVSTHVRLLKNRSQMHEFPLTCQWHKQWGNERWTSSHLSCVLKVFYQTSMTHMFLHKIPSPLKT